MVETAAGVSVHLVDLSKTYGSTSAVVGIDIVVESGEFLTFLGPSGSGKTTTLDMISGFVAPSRGEVVIDGRAVNGVPPHRREIGVVFQHYALFPHMTVFENVAFPLRRRKVKGAALAKRVAEGLGLVRLEGLADRFPAQLSGGQQQRVALARALVFGPRLLLLDEPLGALDRQLRDALQVEIRRIHDELGTTFVYVTHDQEEALTLSDRIAIFNGGRIEQIGTGEAIYDEPETLFAAAFLGESNLFPGEVRNDGKLATVATRSAKLVVPRREGLRDGDDGVVAVRPEKVTVLRADEPVPEGMSYVHGEVLHAFHLGASHKLVAVSPQGDVIIARSGHPFRHGPGTPVLMAWRYADGTLLPDDPAS